MIKLFLVDLTKNDKFFAQMKCTVLVRKTMIGGTLTDSWEMAQVIKQVEAKYPSLVGKQYCIHFNPQKVI